MKKLIAIASMGLSVGFLMALANAEDTTTTTSTMNQQDTAGQMAGQAQPSAAPVQQPGTLSDKSADTMSKSTTTQTTAQSTTTGADWKSLKSCTDESGITFKRGQKGFNGCVDAMKAKSRSDQMSGTAGMGSTTDNNTTGDTSNSPTDTSHVDSTTSSTAGSNPSSR